MAYKPTLEEKIKQKKRLREQKRKDRGYKQYSVDISFTSDMSFDNIMSTDERQAIKSALEKFWNVYSGGYITGIVVKNAEGEVVKVVSPDYVNHIITSLI